MLVTRYDAAVRLIRQHLGRECLVPERDQIRGLSESVTAANLASAFGALAWLTGPKFHPPIALEPSLAALGTLTKSKLQLLKSLNRFARSGLHLVTTKQLPELLEKLEGGDSPQNIKLLHTAVLLTSGTNLTQVCELANALAPNKKLSPDILQAALKFTQQHACICPPDEIMGLIAVTCGDASVAKMKTCCAQLSTYFHAIQTERRSKARGINSAIDWVGQSRALDVFPVVNQFAKPYGPKTDRALNYGIHFLGDRVPDGKEAVCLPALLQLAVTLTSQAVLAPSPYGIHRHCSLANSLLGTLGYIATYADGEGQASDGGPYKLVTAAAFEDANYVFEQVPLHTRVGVNAVLAIVAKLDLADLTREQFRAYVATLPDIVKVLGDEVASTVDLRGRDTLSARAIWNGLFKAVPTFRQPQDLKDTVNAIKTVLTEFGDTNLVARMLPCIHNAVGPIAAHDLPSIARCYRNLGQQERETLDKYLGKARATLKPIWSSTIARKCTVALASQRTDTQAELVLTTLSGLPSTDSTTVEGALDRIIALVGKEDLNEKITPELQSIALVLAKKPENVLSAFPGITAQEDPRAALQRVLDLVDLSWSSTKKSCFLKLVLPAFTTEGTVREQRLAAAKEAFSLLPNKLEKDAFQRFEGLMGTMDDPLTADQISSGLHILSILGEGVGEHVLAKEPDCVSYLNQTGLAFVKERRLLALQQGRLPKSVGARIALLEQVYASGNRFSDAKSAFDKRLKWFSGIRSDPVLILPENCQFQVKLSQDSSRGTLQKGKSLNESLLEKLAKQRSTEQQRDYVSSAYQQAREEPKDQPLAIAEALRLVNAVNFAANGRSAEARVVSMLTTLRPLLPAASGYTIPTFTTSNPASVQDALEAMQQCYGQHIPEVLQRLGYQLPAEVRRQVVDNFLAPISAELSKFARTTTNLVTVQLMATKNEFDLMYDAIGQNCIGSAQVELKRRDFQPIRAVNCENGEHLGVLYALKSNVQDQPSLVFAGMQYHRRIVYGTSARHLVQPTLDLAEKIAELNYLPGGIWTAVGARVKGENSRYSDNGRIAECEEVRTALDEEAAAHGHKIVNLKITDERINFPAGFSKPITRVMLLRAGKPTHQ